MSDTYENNGLYSDNSFEDNNSQNYKSAQSNNTQDVYSDSKAEKSDNESSYEWNSHSSQNTSDSTEYHYSYVNGNNTDASHNPNNYDSAYSSSSYNGSTQKSNSQNTSYNTDYSSSSYSGTGSQDSYGSNPNYTGANPYGNYNTGGYQASGYSAASHTHQKPKKPKKPKKPASKGFVAAMLIVAVLASGVLGFGGGYMANKLGNSSNGGVNINQVAADNASTKNNAALNGTTSAIVQKTADSVVEIATESVVTGGFAQQYVQQGAGSGVIISEDGYIITNNHVIDGAENISVTLRDGTKSYTAALIGSDEDNDIALIKVDASGLTPATFGDSSSLAVGDYVVAIGNPLGELGGTVTDGIVSALAREVTVDGHNMTLLQHNAQISPGNSGGGLFNSKGELIGIVNAKDSATEVEGIAFAIPVNNVLDIIDDLKNYGYVTGKIDLGMQLTDITSRESAFYYGVNNTGCYVLSVTKGSNAQKAGFRTGDLITKVNGTDVSKSADIESVLKDCEVGDTVKFTVYRSGNTTDLELTLAEYVPSNANNSNKSNNNGQDNSNNSIWDDMFG